MAIARRAASGTGPEATGETAALTRGPVPDTGSSYEDLPALLGRLSGDEKHDTSSYSTLDVLWVLYDRILDPERDRFLLSKGHGPAAYYAVLAAKGFFPADWLDRFGEFESPLGNHPDRVLVPGVEISSGSLGHGLPIAVGVALGVALGTASGTGPEEALDTAALTQRPVPDTVSVFCLVGDGELDEGSNWEAIQYAGRVGLDRLTAVVVDNASGDARMAGRDRGAFPDRGVERGSRGRSRPRRARARVPERRHRPPARGRRGRADMTMRQRFYELAAAAVRHDPRVAVVLADIGVDSVGRHERVFNVGIREQLMIGVAAGLALEGYRPVAHSYAPFLVERPYEQIKLDLGHQDLGAVLVSTGASYDASREGRTHQSPGDVALLSVLPGWTIHVPGHVAELERALASALRGDDRVYIRMSEEQNQLAVDGDGITVVRDGRGPLVLAVGPTLDPVLEATADLNVTVAYVSRVRPLDAVGLRAALRGTDVVLVEPYAAATSSGVVADVLCDRPHRLLALGVRTPELRRYGSRAEHRGAHGLDAKGIRAALDAWAPA